MFVADYDNGIIYKYKPTGSRAIFALGLHHPVGMAFDSSGNLFVADNNAGNIHQGSIYEYTPNGSRTTFAVLDPSDRPADLAFDSMGNLLMADLGGNIYKYDLVVSTSAPSNNFWLRAEQRAKLGMRQRGQPACSGCGRCGRFRHRRF